MSSPTYHQPPFTPMHQHYPQSPAIDTSAGGTNVFVYGILGFVLCQLFAPVAWVKGNEYVRTCAAMGVAPSGLGVAGRILGIVGTVLNAIGLIFVIVSIAASSMQ